MKSRELKPKTPSPTTPSPITAPPENATSNALPRDVLAAWVVLTFAFVATFIPINPARAEQIAPTINETATKPWEASSFDPLKNSKTATAATKTERTLYSAFKKDIAPSAIFLAILDMFSSPSSCFDTQAFFQNTNAKANIPNKGKYDTIISMIFIFFVLCFYFECKNNLFVE